MICGGNMKLAIVGTRTFSDYQKFKESMTQFGWQTDTIISGGARGADALAKQYAEENPSIKYIEYLPDWTKHGKAAGPIRNELIIKDCDMVLCFWDGASRGTASSLSIAKRLKKTTIVIYI